ncbi:uncharacterized protein BXZ73DRAFT_101113 [Epithele typhae]|uniref:uncharacterized protein n=1 Tax=Epithele typhae TaxID=378194 RepID=UPI0020075735|nr:uncharacterized protein BXZ73DRAFT_101113 [Epithele typhae]KAH9933146.1 hypothetical protein BXZ73DRAFT_101113 [Epithele typhae]
MYQQFDLQLDPALYSLDAEEKAFFRALTGINNDNELKAHVIAVQKKAFEVYTHPCIRTFDFAWLKMSRLPAYGNLLAMAQERPDPILLDVGCCLGTDVRRAVVDGFPVGNVVATDISQALWDLGHELFRSSPAHLPFRFVRGNVFDPAFLTPALPLPTSPTVTPALPAQRLTSLAPLQGRVSAIYAGAFFHLFSFAHQEHLARLLAGLLAPAPGSLIFGAHGGRPTPSVWAPAPGASMDCHAPDSWRALWVRVFGEAGVRVAVEAHLRTTERGGRDFFGTWPGNAQPFHVLEWSVTRL